MYLASNEVRIAFALGMMYAFPYQSNRAKKVPPIQYALNILERLTPEERMAINSDLFAIFEVKKITEINTNKGKSMATICGMKPI
jgi:hypothetical protein